MCQNGPVWTRPRHGPRRVLSVFNCELKVLLPDEEGHYPDSGSAARTHGYELGMIKLMKFNKYCTPHYMSGVAYNGIEKIDVKGKDILIIGAGAIGLLGAAVAKALGNL